MISINLIGPRSLLPNEGGIEYLNASQDAWSPGLYLWTFLYNKAHRVNFIGVSTENIAASHNAHLGDFFAGRRAVYEPAALAAGNISPSYRPEVNSDQFADSFATMVDHVCAMKIFYAPYTGPSAELERIGAALVAHFQRLGGRAGEWLNNEPITYDPDDYDESLHLRFERPAFIASMPDDMYI